MASSVTSPLERQLGQMAGLSQMTSASSGGSSIITLKFSLDLSLDVAEQEVRRQSTRRIICYRTICPIRRRIKGQSGRQCGDHAGRQFRHAAADGGAGSGEHARGAEAVANQWCGDGDRRAAISRRFACRWIQKRWRRTSCRLKTSIR